ncbi:MAG: hypothetical protein GXX83_01795 [Gaiellales bacterium]|nr:hypothetical protein [Gaiellales bacterium]
MDADDSFQVLIGIQSYTDDELKSLAAQLELEEKDISRRRRILHGKLDILRAEMVRRLRDKRGAGGTLVGEDDIARLSEILSTRSGKWQPPSPPGED